LKIFNLKRYVFS